MNNIVYKDDYVTIINDDNRNVIPHLPDVDVMITDPPYARQTHVGARSHAKETTHNPATGKRGLVGNAEVLIDFDSITEEDFINFFAMVGSKIKRWAISFCDWHYMNSLESWSESESAALKFIRFGIWDKPNGAPQFTGDRPGNGWESIAILHQKNWRGMMRWNGGGKRAVWTCNKPHTTQHKTQKPARLIEMLLSDFVYPGETILDPFAGVGTTGVACKKLGLKCILIESNLEYCKIAAQRLAETQPMMDFTLPQVKHETLSVAL